MRLHKLLAKADGRYLTREEQQEALNYAASLPNRLKAAAQVEQSEEIVIKGVLEELKKKYPNFPKYHEQAWAKCFRDVQLVVRYNVHAMILDDMKMLEDKVLFWLRTILSASRFTPALVRETYTMLRDGFKRELSGEAYAMMEPFLNRNIEVIADFPEPATPAV